MYNIFLNIHFLFIRRLNLQKVTLFERNYINFNRKFVYYIRKQAKKKRWQKNKNYQ
jgi:hypothetical protein